MAEPAPAHIARLLVAAALCVGASAVPACCAGGAALLEGEGEKGSAQCWRPGEGDNASLPLLLPLPCARPQLLPVEHELWPDGSLGLYDGDLLLTDLAPGSFCLGNLSGGAVPVVATCLEEPGAAYFDEAVVGGCIVVSVVFFALTALVYAALPEIRDLQGKSIINFCVCFAVGLGVLAGMRLAEYSDMALCAARGFLAYFFIICGFFWMNALSIQFLLSIKRPSAMAARGWRALGPFALYAWGLAAALTAAMAAVNFAAGRHPKPGIGLNFCWFINPKQQWVYMYSVMSLVCVANVGIFAYTAVLLWRARLPATRARALRYKFTMTLRLFILMGLPWIFEMAKSASPSHIIWDLLDLFNALQGLLVFAVLVACRGRAVRALAARRWVPLPASCRARASPEDDDVAHTELPLDDLAPPSHRPDHRLK